MSLKTRVLSLFEREEEGGICHTCHGQGTYGKVIDEGQGVSSHEVSFCEHCQGTGRNQEDGDVD